MISLRQNDFDGRGRERAPWLANYPRWVPSALQFPHIPAWRLLEQAARRFPDRKACTFFEQELTYRELMSQAARAAAMLAALGVRRGDRVGLLLPNIPEYLVALNGIWMAGGVAVAISPLMVPSEVSPLLEMTDCRVVIALDLIAPLVLKSDFKPEHTIVVTLRSRLPSWKQLGYAFTRLKRTGRWRFRDSADVHRFDRMLTKAEPGFRPVRLRTTDSPALVQPTGGTTGHPKAAVLTHRNLVANAWQLRHWVGTKPGRDSVLAVLPFFHSYGLSTCAMTGTTLAATIVLYPRFEARAVLRLIERHRPTLFPAVPAMLVALNRQLERAKGDLSSIKFCISGGAPLDGALAEEFSRRSGATVVEGFGLSEASPVTHAGPLDGTARTGTIGLPLPGTDARIVDPKTGDRVLPYGEVGELVVRGPQVMSGYWNDPEATARVIRDGWLHTGDLATCDADGFFRIVDRKKDLIITSGYNVYPAEVEEVLRRFPGISDVAVVGVADPECGQKVKAVLALEDGKALDRKALDRFCREHLSKHKRPRLFEEIQGDLPRNFLGKVLRHRLREPILDPENVHAEPLDLDDGKAGTDGNGAESTVVPANGEE